MDFSLLDEQLKILKKRYKENIASAKQGYDEETKKVCQVRKQKDKSVFKNGNAGIAEGAVKSGLDLYYAYPMTPATSVLGELAENQEKGNYLVLELENETAVITAAIGSAITGAKVMVGTSGGGFDLMTEGLSMAGMAEVPMVAYLSQRPGPASGVATYTAQGDLNLARHGGHGEFPRVVLAPGDPVEAIELTNQAFYFAQKYKTPAILIGDKHLAESAYTLSDKAKIVKVSRNVTLTKFNSYESDSTGIATENPVIIKKETENRIKKSKDISIEAKKFTQYKIHGKKHSKNLIVAWGSPKGAILDAMEGLDCTFLQVLYVDPFSEDIRGLLKNKNLILVENNSTGQLAELIAEKTGVFIEDKNKILRYDARPFLADELNVELKKRLK